MVQWPDTEERMEASRARWLIYTGRTRSYLMQKKRSYKDRDTDSASTVRSTDEGQNTDRNAQSRVRGYEHVADDSIDGPAPDHKDCATERQEHTQVFSSTVRSTDDGQNTDRNAQRRVRGGHGWRRKRAGSGQGSQKADKTFRKRY